MVKLRHFQDIQDRSGAACLGIHAAHDNLGDPGLHDGTGAHLAGLQCHIEGTLFQTPVADHLAGLVDRGDLRMGQGIFVGISAVIAPADDPAFVYDDTADGKDRILFRSMVTPDFGQWSSSRSAAPVESRYS